ncbi:MAG: GNAT family N-acetyltransferase [Rubrivivax sp.]|nr:GNAT family N-acetyltransferase [Rubrivivax sp.]
MIAADTGIRLATVADAAGIAAMSRQLIEHGLGWSWREGRVRRAIADRRTNVAVVGGPRSLAAFGIMSYGERHAHLLLLAVRREQQRRGIGSALLLWLEQVAVLAGVERVVVEARLANDAARCFYSEHGYHERAIERGMYGGIEAGIALEKWLRPALA